MQFISKFQHEVSQKLKTIMLNFTWKHKSPKIVKTTMSNKRKLGVSLSQVSNCTTKLHGPGIKTNMMINRVIYITHT